MKTVLLIFLLSACIYADAEMREKIHDDYQAINKKLNTTLQKFIQSLPKEERQNLINAQKAWVKYRDAECYFQSYPMRDGTGEYTMVLSCLIELTDRRISLLNRNL